MPTGFLYCIRAEQTDQSCLLHTSIHDFQKIINIKFIRLRTRRSEIAPPSYKKRVPVSYIHDRDAEIAGVKKQRFPTLTNDEYDTLSTLLEERESNNTRRAADMARTFDHTSVAKLLI